MTQNLTPALEGGGEVLSSYVFRSETLRKTTFSVTTFPANPLNLGRKSGSFTIIGVTAILRLTGFGIYLTKYFVVSQEKSRSVYSRFAVRF